MVLLATTNTAHSSRWRCRRYRAIDPERHAIRQILQDCTRLSHEDSFLTAVELGFESG